MSRLYHKRYWSSKMYFTPHNWTFEIFKNKCNLITELEEKINYLESENKTERTKVLFNESEINETESQLT